MKGMSRYALVTGASSGIGAATAVQLSKQGFDLVLVGRDVEGLRKTLSHCSDRSILLSCDLSDLGAIGNLVEGFRMLLGEPDQGLSVLVHCAGVFVMGPYEDQTADSVAKMFDVNVRAPFLLTQLLLPELKKAQGHVVFLNSSVANNPQASMAAYSMSKAALRAEADTLRQAVNSFGIKVTSVYPGRTATKMQQAMCTIENRGYRPEAMIQPEDVANVIAFAVALGDRAELTDIPVRSLKPYT